MASRLSSRSKSRLKVPRLNSSFRRSRSGVTSGPLRVLSKALVKEYPWLGQLRPHQKRGAKAALFIHGFAALFAQRTGKTWVTGAVLTAERNVCLDVLL